MKTFMVTMLLAMGLSTASAQEKPNARAGRSYPPQMQGCRVETYKTVGDRLNRSHRRMHLIGPAFDFCSF